MKKRIGKLIAFFLITGWAGSAGAAMISFDYTGSTQQWLVPTNVFSANISAWGAQGQSNALGVNGGLGGFATGTLALNPGDILNIFVGGGGSISTSGGWNGGGNAGAGASSARGGGGGGASDVRLKGTALNDRVIVAAGGGGAGGNRVAGQGRGTGGGGGAGYYGGGGGSAAALPSGSASVATGGTQVSGGSGGRSNANVAGNDGSNGGPGVGGNGGREVSSSQTGNRTGPTGGPGGGLTGSNGIWLGPDFTGASGAGGSSFLFAALTDTGTQSGIKRGNGLIQIQYDVSPVPVPAAIWLFGTALIGLVGFGRRRNAA